MKKAFILSDNPLFARGLERLLHQDCGMNVVGFSVNGEESFDRIRTLEPDIIIVDSSKTIPKPCILLTRLLQLQPKAMVLRVSLEDNEAVLYSARCWTANAIEDLIGGIYAMSES